MMTNIILTKIERAADKGLLEGDCLYLLDEKHNSVFLHGTREEFKRFRAILDEAIGPEAAEPATV